MSEVQILPATSKLTQEVDTECVCCQELTLRTAKAVGFLLLPLLHWPIPEGTATTYTVSTS